MRTRRIRSNIIMIFCTVIHMLKSSFHFCKNWSTSSHLWIRCTLYFKVYNVKQSYKSWLSIKKTKNVWNKLTYKRLWKWLINSYYCCHHLRRDDILNFKVTFLLFYLIIFMNYKFKRKSMLDFFGNKIHIS